MPYYRATADYVSDLLFAARLFASRLASVTEKEGDIMYTSRQASHLALKPLQPSLVGLWTFRFRGWWAILPCLELRLRLSSLSDICHLCCFRLLLCIKRSMVRRTVRGHAGRRLGLLGLRPSSAKRLQDTTRPDLGLGAANATASVSSITTGSLILPLDQVGRAKATALVVNDNVLVRQFA